MAEIVFEMIAVVFQDVETLVLDFPSRPGAGGNFGDVFTCDLEAGEESAVVSDLALGVADGEADPIDHQGVLALTQRRSGEPAIAMGQLFGPLPTQDRDLVERRAVHKV